MATSSLVENSLVIRYQIGVDKKGNEVFKQQSLKNINTLALDEDLVVLSDEIEKLMDYEVSTIKKEQTYIISK